MKTLLTVIMAITFGLDSTAYVTPEINQTYVETTKETDTTNDDVIEGEIEYMGQFMISAYCRENYPHICNNGDATVTATGTVPTSGRTIAVDPTIIPLGSEVSIGGNLYVAEDTGGAIRGNRIDICFDTHYEALQFGIQYKNVFIVREAV